MPSKKQKVNWKELPTVAEPLSNAGPDRLACVECGLWKHAAKPYMMPTVPKGWTGKYLGVGEAPGYHEDTISGRQFTGEAGKLLRDNLEQCAIKQTDIALVNACRCHPKGNKTPTMKQVKACRPFLLQTIKKLQPKNVVGFGRTAMRALTNDGKMMNVTKSRGLALLIPGLDTQPKNVAVTYHPASVLHGNLHHEPLILEDLKRFEIEPLRPPFAAMPKGEVIGVDTEYTKFPERKLLNLATANTECARVFDATPTMGVPVELERAKWLCGHSLTGDLSQLVKLDFHTKELANNLNKWLRGIDTLDSLILSRMHGENREKGGYELETLLRSYFKWDHSWKGDTEEYGHFAEDWPPALRAKRCRLDAWASVVLCRVLHAAVPPVPAVRFNHRLAQTIQRMGLAGARVNRNYYLKVRDEQRGKLQLTGSQLVRKAHSLGMSSYHPTNDNNIRELVYDKLRKPVTELTNKERLPRVDKLTLQQFIDDPIIEKQLEYNTTHKLSSSLDGLEKFMVKYGKQPQQTFLHFWINALGARTGRRSSGGGQDSFNSQNWAGELRRMVVSRFRHGRIVSADQSRVEVRLIAYVSKCQRLLDYFAEGDGYIGVGRDLFNTDIKKDTELYRATKSIVLGINYNMEDWKLAWNLWYVAKIKLHSRWERHLEIAARLRRKYFQLYPELRDYMWDREQELRQTHQVVGILGQVRRLPFPPEPSRSEKWEWKMWRKIYKHNLNQAINFPIQWYSAVVTGCCALDVEERLLEKYKLSYLDYQAALVRHSWPEMPLMFNEVHDELDFDCPNNNKHQGDIKLIQETMEHPPTLHRLLPDFQCPLKAEIVEAPYWKK